MLRVVLKGLLAHKVRLVLTTLSVVIGVAFVAGSFILTDSMDQAFTQLFETTSAGTDVTVRPSSPLDENVTQSWTAEREPLPASTLDEIRAIDGVADATGWVEGVAQVVDRDGDTVGGNGPPTLGYSWSEEGGPLVLRDGHAPEAPGEVVIDVVTVDSTGYELGDTVPIVTQAGVQDFTLVGVVGFGESDNLLGATLAAFELDQARELFGKPEQFDQIAVVAQDGVTAPALRDRIAAQLGDRVEVLTAAQTVEEGTQEVRGALSIITNVLLGFAFVAMFVGGFIIANTFSIIVAQRTREFALLRAVGASARQVRRAVRGEALVVGLVASTLGLGLGVGLAEGLKAAMRAFGMGIPTGSVHIALRTVVWSYAVGVLVTLVATVVPARRAAKVAPVEAMRGSSTEETALHRRTLVGAGVASVGAAVFGLGAFSSISNPAIWIGVGAVAVLLGVAVLSPALARPFAALTGSIGNRLGTAAKLAHGNAGRDRRRTGTTASALMVGLALVTTATVFAASANGSVAETLDQQFKGDLVVTSSNLAGGGMPSVLADDLDRLPELGTVVRARVAPFRADGRDTSIAGVEAAQLDQVLGLGTVEGEVTGLQDGQVAVRADLFEDRGWRLGQTIPVVFTRTGEQELTIVGTFERGELVGAPFLTTLDTFAANVVGTLDQVVLANAADGVSQQTAREAVEGVTGRFPGVQVQNQAEVREEAEGQIDQVLGLMMVLLALALVVALLGVVNTLVLAVFERTREIGLLRAVGMTRRQVRAMVRWESTIVTVFGAVLGVGVGTLFGWAIVRALADEGFGVLVVPGGQLAVYVVAAAVAGIVAAAFPARRAAKLDVLEAVTVE